MIDARAQFKPIAFVSAGQCGADFGHIQRPEEIKVAHFERSHPFVPQRLGHHLQIACAGDQRVAGFRAVATQHPTIQSISRGKEAVACGIKAALIQHRRIHCHARRGRALTDALGQHLCGHANIGPDAPVQRGDAGFTAPAAVSKGVEVFIRRHIIHLPRWSGDGGG